MICPFCSTEVSAALIEAEDGCCPECGAVISVSSIYRNGDSDDEFDDIDDNFDDDDDREYDEYEDDFGFDDMDDDDFDEMNFDDDFDDKDDF